MTLLVEKRDKLLYRIRSYESCAVAFSGGVDSAVVAKAARLALGDRAVAVTCVSPSLASGELKTAQEVAEEIGIQHELIQTNEIADAAYAQNTTDRCYHCKANFYSQIDELIARLGVAVVVDGANADDLADYRPGATAATEHSVRSPLAECGITKAELRELAHAWDLPVWNKPASPCLASRVVYGKRITPERLARIDAAEQFLRSLGLSEVRVRLHRDELARLEVPASAIVRIAEPETRQKITKHLQSLGFHYITLDLEGFRSGSLNERLPVASIIRGRGD